jgi:hypothetical protein
MSHFLYSRKLLLNFFKEEMLNFSSFIVGLFQLTKKPSHSLSSAKKDKMRQYLLNHKLIYEKPKILWKAKKKWMVECKLRVWKVDLHRQREWLKWSKKWKKIKPGKIVFVKLSNNISTLLNKQQNEFKNSVKMYIN